MKRNLLVLLLAAAVLTACGDDDEGNNGQPTGDTGTDVEADAGPDAEPDAEADADGGTGFEGTEEEPNDTAENANAFTVGDAISGRIAAGSGEDSDIDIFSVELTGGTIFEFELTSVGTGFETDQGNLATVMFTDQEGNLSRILAPDFGMKRQAFVPADGTYFVYVYDARAGAQEPTDNGGPNSTYEIATASVTPSPTSATLPVDQSDELEEDGVDVFEITPGSDSVLVAETTATRAPVESDLDTVLYAWSVADSQTIAVNDDFAGQDETYDSSVAFEATSGQTYWVIVDSYINAEDATYNLNVTETDDAPNARRDLAAGDSLTGEIADAGSDDFDTDYYEVTLEPGDTIRLEAAADDALQPRIAVIVSTAFGAFTIAEGWPVDGTSAVEFAHPSSADGPTTYLVNLDDIRNVPADENTTPENVGGDTFGYTLSASDVTWSGTSATLPVTESGTIANVGNYAWYEFTAPANSVVGLRASTSASDFAPVSALLSEGAAATGESLVQVLSAETTLTAGVRDQYFRGGTGYDFTTEFVAAVFDGVTFNDVSESESNDSQAEAQAITGDLPAAVTGALDAAGPSQLNPDYYAVNLTQGAVLGVMTEGDDDGDTDNDADTVITVLDSDGNTIATNDDYPGQDGTYFSAAAFSAPADGDYFIVVEPYCTSDPNATDCSGNGNYVLKTFLD